MSCAQQRAHRNDIQLLGLISLRGCWATLIDSQEIVHPRSAEQVCQALHPSLQNLT